MTALFIALAQLAQHDPLAAILLAMIFVAAWQTPRGRKLAS